MSKNRFLLEMLLLALLGLAVGGTCNDTALTPELKRLMEQDRAKEREAIAAAKEVKIALERYAADHDGCYPKYIWGGDRRGWDNYYRRSAPQGSRNGIYDPLIRYGYLDSYAKNPFIINGGSVIKQTSLRGVEKPGEGDPRFGYGGDRIGNGLSDRRFPEADDTLGGARAGKWGGGSSATIAGDPGQTYTFGGWWSNDRRSSVSSHWPGMFFYRSAGEVPLKSGKPPSTYDVADGAFAQSGGARGDARAIVDLQRTDRYMLGCYGSSRTPGFDVIRMGYPPTNEGGASFVGKDGAGIIRSYAPLGASGEDEAYPIMFPECMGRGDSKTPPRWPYKDPKSGDWLYVSSDGSRDGVICAWVAGKDDPLVGKENLF